VENTNQMDNAVEDYLQSINKSK